jgi:hypothetical protein
MRGILAFFCTWGMTGFLGIGGGLLPVALASDFAGANLSHDPSGESAYYVIERNNQRTSSMIRSGEMTATVGAYLPTDPAGPSFDVRIDYVMSVQIIGTQRGTKTMPVPEEYFTARFMEDLRASGQYDGPTFKVRHLGYADARNMDGAFYPNCDKVLIYDIEDASVSPLTSLAASMFRAEIENMEIIAHIKGGIPVLGAVKLDVSGDYSGQAIKAGADYQAP